MCISYNYKVNLRKRNRYYLAFLLSSIQDKLTNLKRIDFSFKCCMQKKLQKEMTFVLNVVLQRSEFRKK